MRALVAVGVVVATAMGAQPAQAETLPPTISKSFQASSIPVGGTTVLDFVIHNPNSASALTGVGFTDTLPAGLIVPGASTPISLGFCGGTLTIATSSISLSGASLAANGGCTQGITVRGTTPGDKNNSVTVTSDAGTGNTAMASLTVVGPPTISKSFQAASIPVGGTTNLDFVIQNPNSGAALTGIGFTDSLPAGLIVPGTSTPISIAFCGGTLTLSTSSISLSGASLAANGGCTQGITVRGTTPGDKNNSVTVTSDAGTGNTAMASLTVLGPPTIDKSFQAASIPVGGTTVLDFTIHNPNTTGGSLTGIGFTDSLPAGLIVPGTSTPISIAFCGGTLTLSTSSISLSGASLAANGGCTQGITVRGTTPGDKNNSVTVTSDAGTGNTAMASLTVVGPPTVSKSFGAATIQVGASTTLSFTVSAPEANTTDLNGIAFTDTLPAGLVVATPNGLTGTCGGGTITATAGSSSVALSGATLAPGGNCTFSVNVTGTTVGPQNNSVTVTSTNGGTGNTAMASVTVGQLTGPPTVSKSFGAATISVGGSTTLSFTVSAPSSNTASVTGIAFTDSLPAGLVVATPNGLSGSCGGGTITATAGSSSVALSGATLAPSGTCTFSVNVTATTPGMKNNSVTVTSDAGTGNTAMASLTVNAAAPTLSSQASAGGPVGTVLTDTATVAGGASPTGNVTFGLFTDSACTHQVLASTNALVGGSATSSSYTPSGPGTYYWTATYNGDANNATASAGCNAPNESVTVTPAAPPPCTVTLTGDVTGPLTVLSGQTYCINSARVTGPITVQPGGALIVNGSRITNGIVADGATYLSVCGSQVTSPLTDPTQGIVVRNSTGTPVVGDPATGCAGNRVAGDVTFTGNIAGVTFGANIVSRNVTVNNNAGATVIKANTTYGRVACSANNPAPTNAGQPNTSTTETGQCAGL